MTKLSVPEKEMIKTHTFEKLEQQLTEYFVKAELFLISHLIFHILNFRKSMESFIGRPFGTLLLPMVS